MWPPRFRNNTGLSSRRFGDLFLPLLDPRSTFLGQDVAIEECVTVDCTKVRSGAELDVIFHSHWQVQVSPSSLVRNQNKEDIYELDDKSRTVSGNMSHEPNCTWQSQRETKDLKTMLTHSVDRGNWPIIASSLKSSSSSRNGGNDLRC